MTKTVEYRAVPRDVWTIVRFEREDDGALQASCSSHCGEFPNEELATKYGQMIANSESGARFCTRTNRAVSKAGSR